MSTGDDIDSKICVDIQRSDGRIHSAFITLINAVEQSVMVQWKENGELKGKEITLDDIIRLNPNLFNDLSSQVSSTSNLSKLGNGFDDDYSRYSQLKKVKPTNVAKIQGLSCNLSENRLNCKSTTENNKSHNSNTKASSDADGKIDRAVTKFMHKNERNEVDRSNSKSPYDRTLAVRSIVEQVNLPTGLIRLLNPGEQSLTSNTDKSVVGSNLQEKVLELDTQGDIVPSNLASQWVAKNSKKINGANNALHISVHVKESQYNGVVCPNRNLISIDEPNKLILHTPPSAPSIPGCPLKFDFEFDSVYSTRRHNTAHVYRSILQPAIQALLKSITKKTGSSFVSCLLYDCSPNECESTIDNNSSLHNSYLKEIYGLAVSEIFRRVDNLNHNKDHARNLFAVYLNAFEISNKKIFDLLNRRVNIEIIEDHRGRISMNTLKEEKVGRLDDLNFLYKIAGNAAPKTNEISRNHVIFKISIKHENTRQTVGHFFLINLATTSFKSNDLVSDIGTNSLLNSHNTNALNEKKLLDLSNKLHEREVSKSLRTLRECLRAIGRTGAYIPSRVSRLTQILRDCFQNPKAYVCLLGTLDGSFAFSSVTSWLQSLNSLRYLDSIKELSGPIEFIPYDRSPSPSLQRRLVSPVINAADNLIPNQIIPEDEPQNSTKSVTLKKCKEEFSEECESVFDDDYTEYTMKSEEHHQPSVVPNVGNVCDKFSNKESNSFIEVIRSCSVVQEHQLLMEEIKSWTEHHDVLMSMFKNGNCDLNEFTQKFKTLVREHSNKLVDIYEKVENLDVKDKTLGRDSCDQ